MLSRPIWMHGLKKWDDGLEKIIVVPYYMGTWIKKLKGKIENFNIPLSVAKCFLKIFSTENGSY